ncbi:MAG: o-succinylbenzoate--CoA ligase, partial [Chlorobiaceae bacterium]|nr:o-succinylbenzoate--CoA ligase [Chlorobiaceae bacterium]
MDIVGKAAALFGDLPALRVPGKTISFNECRKITEGIACRFLSQGLKQGDVVAVVSPNTPDTALLLLGLLKAALVAAPLNCRFPLHLIEQTVEKLRPQLLLTGPNEAFELPGIRKESISKAIEESTRFDASVIEEPPENPERPVTIIHTSASTGSPKAALHSFSNHWHNALGSNVNISFGPGDCWLLSLPFYHIGGYAVIFRALASGASMAAGNPGVNLASSLKEFPVTHLSLVPTQLYRLLGNPETAELLTGMKAILLGGSPAPKSLIEEAVQLGLPLYLSYGSTEMGSQISTTPGPVSGLQQDSGRILPFREVMEAVDGELLVRGECLFSGYLSGGELDPRRDGDGWFHTRDIGRISEDGRITVLGRKDNMFISGGENIHPEEVEKALMTIDGIMEAIVVPVPDREYGQRPAAFIRTFGKNMPADAEIDLLMKGLAGKLKAPVCYWRVDEWTVLPGSQKTDRAFYRRL